VNLDRHKSFTDITGQTIHFYRLVDFNMFYEFSIIYIPRINVTFPVTMSRWLKIKTL